jgi:hypothetical protein
VCCLHRIVVRSEDKAKVHLTMLMLVPAYENRNQRMLSDIIHLHVQSKEWRVLRC